MTRPPEYAVVTEQDARFAASVERGRRDEQAQRERTRTENPINWPAKKYGCPCAQCRHS